MSRIKVLFLIEVGSTAGLGHMRRMQVLARAMREIGWDCKFGVSDVSVLEELRTDEFTGAIWKGNGLDLGPTDILIVDGYKYPSDIFQSWKGYSRISVALDDLADRPMEADILLNHNIYGHLLDYSEYSTRHLLVGSKYSLVDQQFLKIADSKKPSTPHMLISFGATDDGRFSISVAAGILDANSYVVIELVISPFFKFDNKFKELSENYPGRIKVHSGVDMAVLMQRCEIFVGAAGLSVIEALAAGLYPVVCSIADNQKLNIKELQALGLCAMESYNSNNMINEAVKAVDADRLNRDPLVDGKGAFRIIDCIKESIEEGLSA